MPVIVKIAYENGYAVLGTPDAYTMNMLFAEFDVLTPGWRLLPAPCCKRDAQGWVIREILKYWKNEEDFTDNDLSVIRPPRIQEGAARGTEINLKPDPLRRLDHWAQADQAALV